MKTIINATKIVLLVIGKITRMQKIQHVLNVQMDVKNVQTKKTALHVLLDGILMELINVKSVMMLVVNVLEKALMNVLSVLMVSI